MNRITEETLKTHPYDEANIISKYLYWWMRNLLKLGLSRQIEEDDIYKCCNNHKSDKTTRVFKKHWHNELIKNKPNLLNAFMNLYGKKVFLLGFCFAALEITCKIMGPLMLGYLILYFMDNPYGSTKTDAYLFATGIVLTSLVPILFFHPYILYVFQVAIKVRVACCSLIYEKVLSFPKHAIKDGITGQAINLMSNDVYKFDWALSFFHDLYAAPIKTILAAYFIYEQIGYAGLIGMLLLLLFIPFEGWLGRLSASIRLSTALRTDKRVKFMLSILNGIHVIKMYAWEKSFAKIINEIRKHEIQAIKRGYNVKATLLSFRILTKLALFVSLLVYVLTGQSVTAQKTFVVISYFNVINGSMVEFWPLALSSVAEGYVSVKRVQQFLLQTVSVERNAIKLENGFIKNGVNHVGNNNNVKTNTSARIMFKDATAYWKNDDESNKIGISSVNLTINDGITAIIGPVGSGKTTLLEAILKEIELVSGELNINGVVSYAPQQAWIFQSSVKNNILFTEDYDETRYKKVIEVCALLTDFDLLPHGDETIVGERGVSLSGGQKARISLARAIYKKADIYLLDDPLSAVDVHVGNHIFENCIKTFLGEKCCVLVTHQLQYLHDVNNVAIMNMGQVQTHGKFEYIKNALNDLHIFHENNVKNHEQSPQNEIIKKPSKKEHEEQTIVKENQQIGKVRIDVYKAYLKAVNNLLIVVFVLLLFIITQALTSGVDYFVSMWVDWEEVYNTGNLPQGNYTIWDGEWWTTEKHVYLYSILMGIMIIFITLRSFSFYHMCLRASMNLHDKLFRGITRSIMYFFHTNSTGRILNRFSKDMGSIDSMLPTVLVDCVNFFLELAAITTIVAIINYWLLFPTLIMCILFYALRFVFLTTARNVKRIEAISRSPMFSHTTTSMEGLTVIRAFSAEKQLIKEFDKYQDKNTSSSFLFLATTRGFAFWLDLICFLYITAVVYSFLLLEKSLIGADVGLAITQVISLIGMCNWGIRQTAELENLMTSVERVIEYTELPKEPPLETPPNVQQKLHQNWPQWGAIKFENVSLKYSENADYVLKNLNFSVAAGEKVGIVGRTGSGKSSIAQAIFQLAVVDGKIEIDNVDLKSLGLHAFRGKISIIPQDPIMFVGSLRNNLDPFNEKTDDEIWDVLEQVELKEAIKSFTGGLHTKISDGGTNFSMGQRQLICLARAILKNNRILILDEATANVDQETDHLVQHTIRARFSQCTVLTIAHRLHSILDSDRILVMDAGRILEFDSLDNLLKIPNGIFRKMFEDSGLNDKSTKLL